jgi:hypothetical protein
VAAAAHTKEVLAVLKLLLIVLDKLPNAFSGSAGVLFVHKLLQLLCSVPRMQHR